MENIEIDYLFRCPRCHQLSIYSLFYDNEYKIKFNCFCGNYKETISFNSLYEYQQKINTLINNQMCEVHPAHINEEGIEYCMICDKWACSQCRRKDDHKVMNTYKEIDLYCLNHNQTKPLVSSYCAICNLNMCNACCEEHNKKYNQFYPNFYNRSNHWVINKSDIENCYSFFMSQFQQAKEAFEYNEKMVDFVLKKYPKAEITNSIKFLFNQYKAIYTIYFSFIDKLNETYIKNDKAVFPLLNLYNNSHFNTQRIKINKNDSILTKINTIASYLFMHQYPNFDFNSMNSIENDKPLFFYHDIQFNRTFHDLDMFIGHITLKRRLHHKSIKLFNFDYDNYEKEYLFMNMSFTEPEEKHYSLLEHEYSDSTNSYVKYYMKNKGRFYLYYYPFIDYEDKSKIIKQHYTYTDLGRMNYYMNYSSYEKIVAIKDKKINLIEPSNMNVEGTITIKEEYSSVKLLRQINNDIYGFATERNLYLIDMKNFQFITIIELDIPEDAKYIDVITRNEYYELRYTINGYDWMSLTNITFNGEYYQI